MPSFLAIYMDVLAVCKSRMYGTQHRKLSGKLAVVLLFTVMSGQLSTVQASDSDYADYQLKAAFILNFPNFITWPQTEHHTKNVICTFADDAVAQSIEALLASTQMAERKTRITFAPNPDINKHCDLAFVGTGAQSRMTEIISRLQTTHTLVVSDVPNYAVDGGMIELALVNTKIRVILNREVMTSRGFVVDSRLLQLTTQVTTSGPKVEK